MRELEKAMLHRGRLKLWVAVFTALLLTAAVVGWAVWLRQQPISLRGAVLVKDPDPRKQLPVAGVVVSASDDFAPVPARSDSSGLFVLKLRKPIRRGHPITLYFTQPRYHAVVLHDFVSNKLYLVHLVPLADETSSQGQPQTTVSNVRARYTVKAMTELNVGSEVRTFEIQNKGNIPCKGQHPCSPDGQWKAALGSGSLDAGPGNEFRDARVSCIAGPCPFTRIESNNFSRDGQIITVSARDWSDTTTFLLEAEVFRPMVSQTEHWSYPVIYGDRLTFTLPDGAESVSIQADLNRETIIFPLGPSIFLSWANCESGVQDRARFYRCALKSGYRFE